MALWRRLDFLATTLFVNLFDPGAGWRSAQQVSSTPEIVTDSQISIDANGDVAVIWDADGSPPNEVLANTVISGVVGTERSMGTGRISESITAGPPGGPVAIALWEHTIQRPGSTSHVLETAEYDLGSGWSAIDTLPGTGPHRAIDTAIVTPSDGRRLAVWGVLLSVSNKEFRYAIWTPGSGWSAPATAISSANALGTPYLVAGADGRSLLVWVEPIPSSAGKYTIFGSWFDGVAWGPTTPLATQTGLIIFRDSLRVAADQQGNATVVWQHTAGDPSDPATIRAVRYRNGAWEAPIALSAGGAAPSLAMNAAGDTVAAWLDINGVTARGFTAANPTTWSSRIEITQFFITAKDVEVALEPDGSFVTVWIKDDGTLWSSRGRVQ